VAKAFKVVVAGQETAVKGDLSWADARTLRFQPAEALARETVYDVILTQDAAAETGEPLREPLTFRLRRPATLKSRRSSPTRHGGCGNGRRDHGHLQPARRPPDLAQADGGLPQPLAFDPPVAGKGEWLNTSIYVFKAGDGVSGGIPYRATVVAGLTDIGGAVLRRTTPDFYDDSRRKSPGSAAQSGDAGGHQYRRHGAVQPAGGFGLVQAGVYDDGRGAAVAQ
jgi:hypothetical protein